MRPSPVIHRVGQRPSVASPPSTPKSVDRARDLASVGLVSTLFISLYVVAVRTETGQWFDNLGMYAATAPLPRLVTWSSRVVLRGTIPTALLAIALIVRRGRPVGGSFGAAVRRPMALIAGAEVTAEVLKLVILPRPNLLDADAWLNKPAFPSGHLTLALSIGVAGIIATANGAYRRLTAATAWLAATAMATTLLVTHSHRISELAGSCLVVIAATLVAVRPENDRGWPRLEVGWTHLATGTLVSAVPFVGWGLSTATDVDLATSAPLAALLVGQALAAAGWCAIVIGIACSRSTRTVTADRRADSSG